MPSLSLQSGSGYYPTPAKLPLGSGSGDPGLWSPKLLDLMSRILGPRDGHTGEGRAGQKTEDEWAAY